MELARALGWFRAEADASLSMITIRILYPCFILFHILESQEFNSSTFLISLIGFLSILLGFFSFLAGFKNFSNQKTKLANLFDFAQEFLIMVLLQYL